MILKQQVDHCISIGMGVGCLALPWAGHIKRTDAVVPDERGEQKRRALSGDLFGVNELVGLAFFDAKTGVFSV
jgi:hypothetical protein